MPLGIKAAILGPGEDRPKQWDALILNHLNKLYPNEYSKVASHVMMGIYSLVLAKTKLMTLISNIKTIKVKTGFGGMVENKGSVVIRY